MKRTAAETIAISQLWSKLKPIGKQHRRGLLDLVDNAPATMLRGKDVERVLQVISHKILA